MNKGYLQALYDVQGQCCECDKDMTKAEHYIAYLCCTKCRVLHSQGLHYYCLDVTTALVGAVVWVTI